MNQPGLSCANLIDNLIFISLPLQLQVLPLDDDQDGADMDFAYDGHPTESSNDVEITLYNKEPYSSNIEGSQYCEDFTGATEMYGT